MDIPMMEELKNNTNEAKEELLAKLEASGAVKRIQRGYVPGGTSKAYQNSFLPGASYSRGFYVDIAVNEIDLDGNYVVLVDAFSTSDVWNLTSATNLMVFLGNDNTNTTSMIYGPFAWQVVEFY